MVQPPLDHHYVVLHLGGSKRVERRHDGPAVSTIIEDGALTIVPAGTAFTWRTAGPIAFAHLYLRPEVLDDAFADDPRGAMNGSVLIDRVGCRDHFLEPLFRRMLAAIESPKPSTVHLDCLLESFLIRLGQKFGSRKRGRSARSIALSPYRLQHALDFIEANLGRNLRLADLVEAAGSSQFHFSHAFRIATGVSPYRYLIDRRIEFAKLLLLTDDDSLEGISLRCGFNSSHQFAVMFKREVGVGPKKFRLNQAIHGR